MSKNPTNLTNGIKKMAVEDPLTGIDDAVEDGDFGGLDKELDELNTALDKMENWSSSFHDKVADFLKEAQERNTSTNPETGATAEESSSLTEGSSSLTEESSSLTEESSSLTEESSSLTEESSSLTEESISTIEKSSDTKNESSSLQEDDKKESN